MSRRPEQPLTPTPEQQELINISLTEEQKSFLTVELNTYLRAKNMQPEHAEVVNEIFKQLTGYDHENIGRYRSKE